MGDRGNTYITDTDNPRNAEGTAGIYLYTHWSGYNQPARAQAAVKAAEPRWGDNSYCTRIIIDQMTKELRDEATGGGISLSIGDNEYEIVCVDVGQQVVGFASPGNEPDVLAWYHVISFEDLVKLPELEGYPDQHAPAPWEAAKNAARIAELEAEIARLRG